MSHHRFCWYCGGVLSQTDEDQEWGCVRCASCAVRWSRDALETLPVETLPSGREAVDVEVTAEKKRTRARRPARGEV